MPSLKVSKHVTQRLEVKFSLKPGLRLYRKALQNLINCIGEWIKKLSCVTNRKLS
jgi:hypothetical protein